MKKIIALSLLFVPLFAFAEESITINGIEEPQWKDFAPPAFVKIDIPKGIGKFNDTAVYWYKRKTEFEDGIEKCRAIENNEEKFSCYQQLKVKQYAKNSDYNARLEAMEQAQMGPREMYDRTNNMLPISGQIGNFMKFQPNEMY